MKTKTSLYTTSNTYDIYTVLAVVNIAGTYFCTEHADARLLRHEVWNPTKFVVVALHKMSSRVFVLLDKETL